MNIRLLRQIREADGRFVPIAALGDDSTRVRTDLMELESFGYRLEWHPYLGVAYRGPAHRLCPDQIECDLGTRRIGQRIAVWNRVPSTNDLAAQAASSLANEGLVVMAEDQASGRGRRGRVWSAPPHSSLLMSILVFPRADLAETAWLTALGAVATAEVVSSWTGRDARIKWPNDVRVDGRKIAGVLVERGQGAVIGIGLNANIAIDQFPHDLQATATSLQNLLGSTVDRSELARALIRAVDHWYHQGTVGGPDTLNPGWRARYESLGQRVRVETRHGTHVGVAEDVDLVRGLTLSREGAPPLQLACGDLIAITPIESER